MLGGGFFLGRLKLATMVCRWSYLSLACVAEHPQCLAADDGVGYVCGL